MKVSLREAFWIVLLIGMGLSLYLARLQEARSQAEITRFEWKTRVLSEFLRGKGTAVADDGKVITVVNADGKTEISPHGFNHWNANGGHATASFPKAAPYYFPPARKK